MFQCLIISPSFKKEYSSLNSVFLPTKNGGLEILNNHGDMFVILVRGNLVLKQGKKLFNFFISETALASFKDNKLFIVL